MKKLLRLLFNIKEENEEIPEMKIPPKIQMTFNKELGRWIIGGNEEEVRKEEERKNKPPPSLKVGVNTSNQVQGNKKKPLKKYANILEDSIENEIRKDTLIEEKKEEDKFEKEVKKEVDNSLYFSTQLDEERKKIEEEYEYKLKEEVFRSQEVLQGEFNKYFNQQNMYFQTSKLKLEGKLLLYKKEIEILKKEYYDSEQRNIEKDFLINNLNDKIEIIQKETKSFSNIAQSFSWQEQNNNQLNLTEDKKIKENIDYILNKSSEVDNQINLIKLNSREQKIKEMSDSILKLNMEITNYHKLFQHIEMIIDNKNSLLKEINIQINKVTNENNEKETKISHLSSQNSYLNEFKLKAIEKIEEYKKVFQHNDDLIGKLYLDNQLKSSNENTLMKENSNLKATISNIEKQFFNYKQTSEETLNALKQEVKQQEQDIKRYETISNTAQICQNRLTDMEKKYLGLERIIDLFNKGRQSFVNYLYAENEDYEKIQFFEKENEDNFFSEYLIFYKKEKNKLSQLNSNIIRLNKEIYILNEKVDCLERENEVLILNNKQLEDKLRKICIEKDELIGENISLYEKNNEYDKELFEYKEKIQRIESEYVNMNHRMNSIIIQKNSKQEEINIYKLKLKEYAILESNLNHEKEVISKEINETILLIEGLYEKNIKLTEEELLKNKQFKLELHPKEKEILSNSCHQNKNRIKDKSVFVNEIIKDLNSRILLQWSIINRINLEVENEQTKNKLLQMTVERLENEKSLFHNEKIKVNELILKLNEYKSGITTYKHELSREIKKIQNLENENQSQKQEIIKFKEVIDKLQKEMRTMSFSSEKKIEELSKLSQVELEVKYRIEKEKEELQSKIKNIQEKIDNIKEVLINNRIINLEDCSAYNFYDQINEIDFIFSKTLEKINEYNDNINRLNSEIDSHPKQISNTEEYLALENKCNQLISLLETTKSEYELEIDQITRLLKEKNSKLKNEIKDLSSQFVIISEWYDIINMSFMKLKNNTNNATLSSFTSDDVFSNKSEIILKALQLIEVNNKQFEELFYSSYNQKNRSAEGLINSIINIISDQINEIEVLKLNLNKMLKQDEENNEKLALMTSSIENLEISNKNLGEKEEKLRLENQELYTKLQKEIEEEMNRNYNIKTENNLNEEKKEIEELKNEIKCLNNQIERNKEEYEKNGNIKDCIIEELNLKIKEIINKESQIINKVENLNQIEQSKNWKIIHIDNNINSPPILQSSSNNTSTIDENESNKKPQPTSSRNEKNLPFFQSMLTSIFLTQNDVKKLAKK